RLERPSAIAWDADVDLAAFRLDGLRRVAVAAISRAAAFSFVRFVSEMLGHFRVEHSLHERALETLHQSLWPEELVRGFTTFQKLFEELGLDGDVHAVSVPWSYPRSVKLHKFSDTPDPPGSTVVSGRPSPSSLLS